LTIKFTRCTAASPLALSGQLLALRKTTTRRANLWCASLLIARMQLSAIGSQLSGFPDG
jgi:hypothetical protein